MNGGDGEDNEEGDDDGDGSFDDIYRAALDRETDWAKCKDEIKSELLGESRGTENEVEKKIDRAIRTDEKHDEMLTAIASAFNKRSKLAHETDWYILGVEPLYEIDPNMRNPDALLGHDDRDFVVTVEAKTGISKPQNALQQIRDARENVLDHQNYLADQTGHLFEDAEMVLMVPGGEIELAKRAIDTEEREAAPKEPVLLWTYHTFSEERLRLHRDFQERSRTESAHDSRLSQHLSGEGVEIINDPLASGDFYPESNPIKVLRNLFFEIPHNRDNSDSSIRKFTRGEIINLIDDQRTMTHYATAKVAEHICDDLLSRMVNYQLVVPEEPDEDGYGDDVELYSYHNSVDGVNADTIQKNLVSKYKEEWIDQRAEKDAKKQVVEEFMNGQSDMSEFGAD